MNHITRQNHKDTHFDDANEELLFQIACVVFPILLIALGAFLMYGDKFIDSGYACIFHKVTGIYCPGCGGTRAFYHMVHMNWGRSLICNPFVLYSMAVYIIFMINALMGKVFGFFPWKTYPVFPLIYAGVVLLLGQCVIRNIIYFMYHVTCL